MNFSPKFGRAVAAVLMLAALGACTYRAGHEDNPITRSFAWFSYLNADDIRGTCRAGAADRLRIVYNAVWEEQVRTYDFTARPGGRARLKLQVRGDADFSRVIELGDLLGPWRGKTLYADVKAAEMADVRQALRRSGFYQPVPQGTRVESWGFFWVVAACEGGRYRFNVWSYPSKRFERMALIGALKPLDKSGVPFNPPRETWEPDRHDDRIVDRYQLVVRGNRFAN